MYSGFCQRMHSLGNIKQKLKLRFFVSYFFHKFLENCKLGYTLPKQNTTKSCFLIYCRFWLAYFSQLEKKLYYVFTDTLSMYAFLLMVLIVGVILIYRRSPTIRYQINTTSTYNLRFEKSYEYCSELRRFVDGIPISRYSIKITFTIWSSMKINVSSQLRCVLTGKNLWEN